MRNTAALTRLSVSSLLSYVDEMLHYIDHFVDASELDTECYLAVVQAKQLFEKGYNMSRRGNIDLKKVDANRDRAFLYLKHLVLAGCYSPKEEVQLEAEKIKQLMEHIGLTLYRRRYLFETVDINKLVFQISESYYDEAIRMLDLREAIDNLAEANRIFDSSDFTATKERGARKDIAPPSRLRKAFERAIRELWEYVDAQAIINKQSGWVKAKNAVELLNDRHTAQLKRHYTFIKKRKEKMKGDTGKVQEEL